MSCLGSGAAGQHLRMRTPDMISFFETPSGDEMAILPKADLEDLLDARRHNSAMADYKAGRTAALTAKDMRALLASPSPVKFWRKHAGLTQAELAAAARMAQPQIAAIEAGTR